LTLFRTLKEIVDPAHTCLVIWDVQNRLVDSIFNREEFLHNISSFLKIARGKKVPVVYTRIGSLPPAYESGWRTYVLLKRYKIDDPSRIAEFTPKSPRENEIASAVAPATEDFILDKNTMDIFLDTGFEHMMRNRGIETLLFTGIATEYGVECSARQASNRGFYPVVVSDCVSSGDREMHDAALKVLDRLCIVTTSAEIAGAWEEKT
jgi:nicotinamidase-related amidase